MKLIPDKKHDLINVNRGQSEFDTIGSIIWDKAGHPDWPDKGSRPQVYLSMEIDSLGEAALTAGDLRKIADVMDSLEREKNPSKCPDCGKQLETPIDGCRDCGTNLAQS